MEKQEREEKEKEKEKEKEGEKEQTSAPPVPPALLVVQAVAKHPRSDFNICSSKKLVRHEALGPLAKLGDRGATHTCDQQEGKICRFRFEGFCAQD